MGTKVSDGIKVANQMILKKRKLSWTIRVGSMQSKVSFKCGRGCRKVRVRERFEDTAGSDDGGRSHGLGNAGGLEKARDQILGAPRRSISPQTP